MRWLLRQVPMKSTQGRFGGSVSNSAYQPKMDAIQRGEAPHYLFLSYSASTWAVTDLFVVPGYFFTPAMVAKRPPLPKTARRAGWVGSNILLRRLPPEARIHLVVHGQAVPTGQVRRDWGQVAFFGAPASAKGGWGADVLTCIRELQGSTGSDALSLQDFYRAFSERLSALHPENRNIKAKIRQQLQLLRDNHILEFQGGGKYRILR